MNGIYTLYNCLVVSCNLWLPTTLFSLATAYLSIQRDCSTKSTPELLRYLRRRATEQNQQVRGLEMSLPSTGTPPKTANLKHIAKLLSELELQLPQASLASTHNGSFLCQIPDVRRRRKDAIEERIMWFHVSQMHCCFRDIEYLGFFCLSHFFFCDLLISNSLRNVKRQVHLRLTETIRGNLIRAYPGISPYSTVHALAPAFRFYVAGWSG